MTSSPVRPKLPVSVVWILKDSWGLAAQVGADFMLTDNIMLNAQLRYIDIETKGTTYAGTTKVTVDVDVDPLVYMVGLGYKF